MPPHESMSFGLDLSPIDEDAARTLKRDHNARRVARTVLQVSADGAVAKIEVSTTFLVDAATEDDLGRPMLWETMVWIDGDLHGFQRRYATREDAEAGHLDTVELFKRDSSAFGVTITEGEVD